MKIAVVGTGLMGASVALAARARGDDVAGWDPDPDALDAAVAREAVTAADSLEQAVADAELVVVASPIAQLPATVAAVLAAPGDATVTDVGSTKSSVVAAAAGSSRFVGGHPICGSETRGAENASAGLFEGATWFLTPVAQTDPDRHRLVHGFITDVGATPVAIDAAAHDRLVALTSHVPHVLANIVANQTGASRVEGHEPLTHAGGSLRDMTRIAGANPRIWIDIFLDNAERIRGELAEHRRRIEQVEQALEQGDAGLSRALDRRGLRQPPPDARARVPGSRRAAAPARARPRPSRRARRHHAGARRRAHQHRGLRAAPRLAGARRHADAADHRERARRSAPPTCSRRRATRSSSRR